MPKVEFGAPGFWDDQERAQALGKEKKELDQIVGTLAEVLKNIPPIPHPSIDLSPGPLDDAAVAQMVKQGTWLCPTMSPYYDHNAPEGTPAGDRDRKRRRRGARDGLGQRRRRHRVSRHPIPTGELKLVNGPSLIRTWSRIFASGAGAAATTSAGATIT